MRIISLKAVGHQRLHGDSMTFCVGCGQEMPQTIKFCRFCGEQQPGQQLLSRLQSEAQKIQAQATNRGVAKSPPSANETMSTLARLEQLRKEADEAARRRAQEGGYGQR
ncbi:MAG: hypothetical protein HOE92_00580 [Euryarchaeota archaeon]|nr:hypothetical protein [Euryarchaeota archaeon]MBT3970693.1 hypothetical protein [Euryarchaeota archaeon]MBT4407475.1 hypothetical protein [Euryarchaeota archaeon]